MTEAGVAVNPIRADLRERLVAAGIEVLPIETLQSRARALAPAAEPSEAMAEPARVVAVVEYRDGRVTDVIRQARG